MRQAGAPESPLLIPLQTNSHPQGDELKGHLSKEHTGIGSFKTSCRCAFLSNSRALQKAVLLLDKARITDLNFRRKLRIFKFLNSFLRKLRIDLQLSFGQIFVRITGKTDDQKLTIWQMAMTPYYDYRRNSVSS